MEMVFNNSLWRQGSGEGTGPRRAMAGMSPQELAVPSCSTDVTAGQPGSHSPSPAKNTAPSPGERERKRKCKDEAASCSPALMGS